MPGGFDGGFGDDVAFKAGVGESLLEVVNVGLEVVGSLQYDAEGEVFTWVDVVSLKEGAEGWVVTLAEVDDAVAGTPLAAMSATDTDVESAYAGGVLVDEGFVLTLPEWTENTRPPTTRTQICERIMRREHKD